MAASAKRPEIISIAQSLNHIPICDDYEKMISGMMYNPTLPILSEARHRCRGVATDYNQLDAKSIPYQDIVDRRMELLREVVGKVGEGTFIEPPFWPDYGCNVVFGKECFVNFKFVFPFDLPWSKHDARGDLGVIWY
ncbi:maltose acetyltransferase-domain-containing protein [Aspergillus californicus]